MCREILRLSKCVHNPGDAIPTAEHPPRWNSKQATDLVVLVVVDFNDSSSSLILVALCGSSLRFNFGLDLTCIDSIILIALRFFIYLVIHISNNYQHK